MVAQPILDTQRLILRPFTVLDAPAVRRLAGDERIARYTLNIPHPYEAGMAEVWIETHEPAWEAGKAATYAIVRRCDDALAGAIGLGIAPEHHRAEMGYWIGVPYWRKGYCTEAGRALIRLGFEQLGLHRIHAYHLAENPASGRVMQKLGMTHEGVERQHIYKQGRYHDLPQYGILKSEWLALERDTSS